MAYTTINNFITMEFRDIRENTRQRRVELGGLVVVTDDDALLFEQASKSAVRKYWQSNVQLDAAITADSASEVRDTVRLYFRMADDSKAHFDIPDPHDSIFLATTGAGANVVKTKAVLDAASVGTAEKAVGLIIDNVLDGTYLISDGEQAAAYIDGERVTWR